MKHYAYLLVCSDNSIYAGYTTDIRRREEMHNAGTASKCTRSRRPVHMAYYEVFETKSEALKREASFKKLPRSEKLNLINSFKFEYPSE